jgi:hypothetical protein
VAREKRSEMLKKAYSDYGLSEAYDVVQQEAYAIKDDELREDINKVKNRNGISRAGTYDVNTGKHTGVLSIAISNWTPTALLIDGMFVATYRKSFDLMIRVEAPFEVRKKRHREKVAKAAYSVPEWLFDGLERVAEKNIFENWDINDIVVRAEDGTFQLE